MIIDWYLPHEQYMLERFFNFCHRSETILFYFN